MSDAPRNPFDGAGAPARSPEHAPMPAASSSPPVPALPRPIVRPANWTARLIWLVPLIAAIIVGFYFMLIWRDRGPTITIRVDDANDIRTNETPVVVNGVGVGRITAITLPQDAKGAVLHVRLTRETAHLAKRNTVFWIARPDFRGGVLRELRTLILGPRLEIRPGDGEPTTEFVALSGVPVIRQPGVKVLLKTPHLPSLDVESPVYFRGVPVGAVQDVRLGSDGRTANVTLFVNAPYDVLVRTNTRFWALQAADVKGGLLSGVQLQLGSLRSLISGGIEFASPGGGDTVPTDGSGWFDLHDQPEKEWMDWTAELPIDIKPADAVPGGESPIDLK